MLYHMLHKYDTNPCMEDTTAVEWANMTNLFHKMEVLLYFLSY